MDYHELSRMTVNQLREEAKKTGAKGVTGMKKDELVTFLAAELGIEVTEKKAAPAKTSKQKVALSKDQIKEKIAALRKEQETARAANESKKSALLRRRLHTLKRRLKAVA